MKLKQLEWMLADMQGFQNPDINLEQYATSPELAIAIVDSINRLVGLEGRLVADLGCGCGMLMSAVALSYQPVVIFGVEIDDRALAICKQNIDNLQIGHCCELVTSDVLQISNIFDTRFDVVVMNPPFGTKNNAGIDMQFVKVGLTMLLPGGSLFSLHKSSTRDHIFRITNGWKDVEVSCVAELKWNLPNTYRFHKKISVDIDVDLIQYKRSP